MYQEIFEGIKRRTTLKDPVEPKRLNQVSISKIIEDIERGVKKTSIIDEIYNQIKLYMDAYEQGEMSRDELVLTLDKLKRAEQFAMRFKKAYGYLPRCSVKELSFNCEIR